MVGIVLLADMSCLDERILDILVVSFSGIPFDVHDGCFDVHAPNVHSHISCALDTQANVHTILIVLCRPYSVASVTFNVFCLLSDVTSHRNKPGT